METLLEAYREKKAAIRKRLAEFREVLKGSDKDIFRELCFCLFTPQASAVSCDRAVRELARSGLLDKGGKAQISKVLRGKVRFQNNKACYCVDARRLFAGKKGLSIKNLVDGGRPLETREWLVKNVKGLGYKEASHFLRNIGLGRGLAILDVHILKNLKRYGVIDEIPKSLAKKRYLGIEKRLVDFSDKIGIPPEELDLLFWSLETGHIFK